MNTLTSYSWLVVCLLLAVTSSPSWAQTGPTLNLFSGGNTFSLPVSTTQQTLHLVTNTNLDQLVVDPDGLLDRLVVTISGISSLADERILSPIATLPNLTVSSQVSVGRYEYRFGQAAAPVGSFRQLLAELQYSISTPNASTVLSNPSRNISLTVVDNTGLNDTAFLLITLQAANQNPPQFNQSEYVVVGIAENSASGTVVTSQISASDPEGLQVVYSIQGGNGAFGIDASTGVVTVSNTSQLDYEAAPTITVSIIATDTDSFNPLSNTSTLTVNLTDVNDNPPVFSQPVYNFSVVENNVGAAVGSVMATDEDTVGSIVYHIQDTSITNFIIDQQTGAIRVAPGQSLDADVTTGGQLQYSFVVQASDQDHSTTATVNVEVINIEDQRPFIVPISSTRLLNLDAGQTAINLSSSVTPLTVSDDGNVERGVATLRLLQNNVESSFPSQFASCQGSNGTEYSMCGSNLNPQYNLLTSSTLSPETIGSDNPVLVDGTDVYRFNGATGTQSRLLITGTLHDDILSITDDFSTSMWIKFNSGSRDLQYPISFETSAGNRHFSFLFWPIRLNLFYRRDVLVAGSIPNEDLGYGSRVGLSFYWDQSIFGDLRDDKWHFMKLDIDFPKIKFYIDGHVYYVTEGHYFSVTNSIVRFSNSPEFNMPARILDRTSSTSPVPLSSIVVRVGGSVRGSNKYNFQGEMRLLYITSLMDNSLYTCIASCGESVIPSGYVPGSQNLTTNVDGFSTFYNPVSRVLYFNKAGSTPNDYTNFLRSVSFSTRDTIPPEEQGEGRRIELRVSKKYILL